MQRVLDNPGSGERIVIHHSDADLLEFDVFLRPGAHVPAGHVHPNQQEHFTVVSGQVRFQVGRRRFTALPGVSLDVPSGTRHWFGNVGQGTAHLRVEVRPALRMEALLATSAASSPPWSRWLDLALIPLDFSRELAVPHVPVWLLMALLRPLAWLRLYVRRGR